MPLFPFTGFIRQQSGHHRSIDDDMLHMGTSSNLRCTQCDKYLKLVHFLVTMAIISLHPSLAADSSFQMITANILPIIAQCCCRE